MTDANRLEIFLIATPGLETVLCNEAKGLGFADAKVVPGGVQFQGTWPDVWRANLWLRGATRVLVRIGSFRAFHLAQLDKRARKFPWADHLRPDVPLRVEVTTRKSKIYHAGAARQRIERALTESFGANLSEDAPICVKVRIDDNLCTISLDSSGESLHKRGHKGGVGKAPMRETLASLFLRDCGYSGEEPVLDPMCGSGTFVIEAAEIAAGLPAGRHRHFAFEQFGSFDAETWQAMKEDVAPCQPKSVFYGFDRNAGAIEMSQANAERAGVSEFAKFQQQAVADLTPPEGPPGLVIVNPPYGARIGNKKLLFALYGSLGKTLKEHFGGWRVGIVTTEPALARATGLPFLPPGPPIPHGGLKVKLFQTKALPKP
ncbi:THUMP domain-containing class I SAM-dependent RNA methyltransferase [Actibacterium pelagium]|uniref:RNA methyltransferase n=1 Tax=Actibacterium pelagium TaxID=2029103 RepID=A0A917AKB8_9RHOB|nr:RNA methyltransferase [Actibacterium pelagium]GGE55569.1 RNA methyltransferase [Actibacterium pelagium]